MDDFERKIKVLKNRLRYYVARTMRCGPSHPTHPYFEGQIDGLRDALAFLAPVEEKEDEEETKRPDPLGHSQGEESPSTSE